MRLRTRLVAAVLTAIILALIAQRIPFARLAAAFQDADLVTFLAWIVPNTVFYFCWDTLVLQVAMRWFHGDVRYRDLLPVRAASYVVGFFNTNAGRGTLAAYLWRRRGVPILELGGTVIFLVLTEYTQLVAWALLGVFGFRPDVTSSVLLAAGGVAAAWLVFFAYTRRLVRRDWQILRTLRRATPTQYAAIVLLRAPMFVVSLVAHYYGARAFGMHIPFAQMLTFLPVIFMAAAIPITVAHLGTTQAAWLYFFGAYAAAPRLLAFSLAAHLTFTATRALLGLLWLPVAYGDLASTSAHDTTPATATLTHA
jgi:hypothetical protein